jgi:serine/threonine protein kinase/tetratricopeptide (TPR) repeat protein
VPEDQTKHGRPSPVEPAAPTQLPAVAAPPPGEDPLLGRVLVERYRIDAKLGEGGMGAVYLATHTLLDKQVALKVLHADLARKPEIAARFVQEARTASRIRHEHVIDISDFGTTPDGLVFFAMERLTGRDLHQLIEAAPGKRLPFDRAKKIFLQVCVALAAAHARGVIHRDLKPSNVFLIEFLGDPDFVKLLDFGIAKVTLEPGETGASDPLTRTGMLFGTPEYMAPEQARGEAIDARVDVYAMGCILYQLVAGQVPFRGSNFMGVLAMHLADEPPAIPLEAFDEIGAPRELSAVIARALAKSPDERFATIEDLANAVRIAAGDPAVSRRITAPPPLANGMTPERWKRIEDIFHRAIELPRERRDTFLDRECGDDDALRAEVFGLLSSTAGATESLRKLVADSADEVAAQWSGGLIGKRLGPYRLIELLGEGGMGVVYLAERDDGQFRRKVAVKVLPNALGSPQLAARFRDERQILASLDHAGIVRMFDGGTTDDGLPYLVMEHVAGEPITSYAGTHELSVRKRLELVLEICEALRYAHKKLVIHRDIKPSNILVSEEGTPKVLDFGIAKLVDPELDREAREARTRTGAAPLTPGYASPEQARGEAVSVASDVYSLGAVLYELLAGRPPHEAGSNSLETLRAICEDDPPRPSKVAPASLRAAITRDLETVVMKALHKQVSGRYATIEGFAADLRRVLAAEPVPRSRSTPRVAGLVIAGFVAVGAGVAGWRALRSEPEAAAPGATQRRVAIVARDARGGGDAWLAAAMQRLVTRQLRDHDDRGFAFADEATADVRLELVYRLAPTGVQVDALLGEPGPTTPKVVGSASGGSVVEALGRLGAPIHDALGVTRTPDPDPAERAVMAKVGTRSLAAFRGYRALEDEFLSATWVDAPGIAARLERITELDPGWAHPWALRAIVQGRVTPAASTTLDRARRVVDPARDPGGRRLLEALRKTLSGDNPGAFEVLAGALRETPDDALLGWMIAGLSLDRMQLDETIAVLRRFHELRPDLQFGGDLAHVLRLAGRSDEAAAHVRAWADAYPESEQALLELALLAEESGDPAAAQRSVERMILIHGETSSRLASQCEVMLLAGKLGAARAIAEKLLLGDASSRARARYRLGVIAVFEGRFSVAYETLQRAAEEATPLGAESELTQVLEALRGLAGVVGRPGDYRRFTAQLADAQQQFGMYDAASRFELALLDRGASCPAIEPVLASVPDGPVRETTRRYVLRAAASAGCATCADVVQAGLASSEQSAGSLLAFARCAVAQGELDLAERAIRRATLLSVSFVGPQASPYHAILARLELARVLVRTGDREGARTAYDAFLAAWGAADRPLPEVAAARKELATVTSPAR